MSVYGKLGVINTNLMANAAYQGMEATNKLLSMHQNRVATLKKVNGPADDPAGYIIASKMKIEMDGIGVAADNIANAQNMINIANGGASSIKNILTEMRKKVLEACDEGKTADQRTAIQSQIDQFRDEITDIVTQTTWNGTNLLDGSADLDFQTGPNMTTGVYDTTNLKIATDFSIDTLGDATTKIDAITLEDTAPGDGSAVANSRLALASLDAALSSMDNELGNMGAKTKRLDIKSDLLEGRKVQVGAAVSRIEDADLIVEQLEISKLQILQQANLALMAQAQQGPQLVLQLMGLGQ